MSSIGFDCNLTQLCHPREGGDPSEWIPAFAGMTTGGMAVMAVLFNHYEYAGEKMGDSVERKEAASIIHISVPDEQLGKLLLEGKFIAYYDNKYGVTSGEHHIVMKLISQEDQFVLFYLHVPYAYPIPDGVKDTVKTSLEATLNRKIHKMEYINSGTESEKKNIQFRVELGGKTE